MLLTWLGIEKGSSNSVLICIYILYMMTAKKFKLLFTLVE